MCMPTYGPRTSVSADGVAAVETDWRRSSRFPLYIPAASERDALSFFRSHSAHNSNPSEGPLCPRVALSHLPRTPLGVGMGWHGTSPVKRVDDEL